MLNKKMIIFLAVASAFLLSQAYVGGGKATGRPDPPEVFKVTDYLTGLKACITLAFAPDGRLFFLEKNTGRVRVVKDGYFYYSAPESPNNRVVRMKEVEGRGGEPVKVIEIEDHVPASNHNGGNINFGPRGFLYITVGDGGGSPGRSQDDTNLLGKILRVNVRGELPVRYKKPSDIFYAKGLRNSFDMAWNPANFTLYATENGPVGYDEINRIVRGGNYGWPVEKGFNADHIYENPIWDFGLGSVAPTGIVFYPTWGNFPREYRDNMFVVDYNYGRVYRIRLTGYGLDKVRREDFSVWMPAGFADTEFADITVGPDGALYLAGFSKIVKIEYIR
jgi:glucose/arabinose dehydrogenase